MQCILSTGNREQNSDSLRLRLTWTTTNKEKRNLTNYISVWLVLTLHLETHQRIPRSIVLSRGRVGNFPRWLSFHFQDAIDWFRLRWCYCWCGGWPIDFQSPKATAAKCVSPHFLPQTPATRRPDRPVVVVSHSAVASSHVTTSRSVL